MLKYEKLSMRRNASQPKEAVRVSNKRLLTLSKCEVSMCCLAVETLGQDASFTSNRTYELRISIERRPFLEAHVSTLLPNFLTGSLGSRAVEELIFASVLLRLD